MNSVIVYWSRYGNGKKVVDYLSGKLEEKGVETKVLKTDDADPEKLPDADFYVFSTPTEAFRVQGNMRKFMKKLEGMEGKKYGIINTHRMKRNWLKSMEKILSKKKKMKKLAGIDFRVGDGTETGEGLPKGWKSDLNTFAEKLVKG